MMNYMWKKMKEIRSKDSGFTLIELLIVILILGILAGIAIFSYQGFAARASAACEEANARMQLIADAANEIDPSIAVFHEDGEPDCENVSGPPSGGTGLSAAFVAGVSGTTTVANPGATAGELLVAIAVHRQGGNTGTNVGFPGTPGTVANGWTFRGEAGFKTEANTSDRRVVAVWTKIAAGGTADAFTPSLTDIAIGHVAVQRFSVTAGSPASFTFVETDGTAATGTSIALGSAAGGSGNSLMIVGFGARNDATAISGFSWTGASNATSLGTAGGVFASIASATVSGAGPHSASASWTNAKHASGFVLIVR